MELYIEYVIIDNLLIDFCLLRLLGVTFKEKFGKWAYFSSLFVGVIGAVFLPFLYEYKVLSVFYRVTLCLLMVLLIKRPRTFKMYIKYVFAFVGYTILLGGAIVAVLNALGVRYTISGVMCYNLELPMGVLLGIILISLWVVKKVIQSIMSGLRNGKYIVDIVIRDGDNVVGARGYLDSGNLVEVDGNFVSIISIDTFLKLHKEIGLARMLYGKVEDEKLRSIKYINIGGMSGGREYLSFVVDKLAIGDSEYRDQRLAVAYKNFGEFDCILSSNYMGVGK